MERFFRYTLAALITSVAAIQFYQVVMRYVFETSVMGLEEILVYPTLWLYFLGSVNASREDTQIKANVLDVFLSTDRARLVVRTIADTMALVVSCWLTYWAYDYFRYALRVWKESPTLYIPTVYAESAVFIGLVLMTIFTAYYLVLNLTRLFTVAKPEQGV
ncbi:MAG: TRAP transporter small permease subunit [Desulforhopalus sp.]|jgi:TRAP-type C4-dicarboxylate transport system permease small subunit|nr:TRAP transporter small permease subunit [Desulforhopalus sp.]HSL40571.1 TRAP transporter small permease subunit [Desulforhopalus sp.]